MAVEVGTEKQPSSVSEWTPAIAGLVHPGQTTVQNPAVQEVCHHLIWLN